jgi:GT2 family glycosyltransferase
MNTLCSIAENEYPRALDILLVDNHPQGGWAAPLFGELAASAMQVRYVAEERPGPAWARNAGLALADSEVVVFFDDDVIVDGGCLKALAAAYRGVPDAGCVTTLIVPIELETQEQELLEEYGGFTKGFAQRTFRLAEPPEDEPLFPYAAGKFGSGAGMAFRASALREAGGFHLPLGSGRTPPGGEDLMAFLDVLRNGYSLVYEPQAIVHHLHRRRPNLKKALFRYGIGLGAYMTACAVERPREAWPLAKRSGVAANHLVNPASSRNRQKSPTYPIALTAAELGGVALGPFAYFRGRLRSKRLSGPRS